MFHNAKRKLALLLAAVMLVGLLPTSALAAADQPGTDGTQITQSGDNGGTTTPPAEVLPGEDGDTTVPPAETQPGEDGDATIPPAETLPGGDFPTTLPSGEDDVIETPAEPEPVAIPYDNFLLSTAKLDQPFDAGTLGSANFRIPALVTLNGDTLVAAADARWDHTTDGNNVDTMVSVSTDGGQSWTTSLVNYFADTADVQDSNAASFIDPALATDGETVYLLVDVFPGGVSNLNDCQKGTGYDGNGNLMLKKSGESDYNYYVGAFDGDYAPIMSSAGEATNHAVDEHYDLYTVSDGVYTAVNYRNDDSYGAGAYVAANVFYKNAEFTVFPTSYLWLVKSTDGGTTWSAPQILNSQVKHSDNYFYGVGPGRGVVVGDTIYFSCYEYTPKSLGDWEFGKYSQKSSLIYSPDGGETWQRTDSLANAGGGSDAQWSSENQAVALNDGTIRMFYRNGRGVMCYVDLNGSSWSAPVSLENQLGHIHSNCQLSVLHYSQPVNGKETLLVSCPSDLNSRINGKIFVLAVNEGNTLSKVAEYQVNTGAFQYSCLTELADGSIGILYENGDASIVYDSFSLNTILGLPESGEFPQISDEDGIFAEAGLSMEQGGSAKSLTVALDEGQTLSASSSDTGVVTADAQNGTVTITPVGAGTAMVTLTVSTAGAAARSAAAELTKTLQVTVTAPAVATYGFIGNTGNENTGKDKPVTKLTTNVGQSYSVRLDTSTEGQAVEWSSSNTGVASVNNGTITANGQGTATITATVKNGDGSVVGTATMEVAVIADKPSRWDIKRNVHFYIDEITNTTAYYSRNVGELVQLQAGEILYLEVASKNDESFSFYGAPSDGYALTLMTATNSAGQYYSLHKDGVLEKNDPNYFYNAGAGNTIRGYFGNEAFESLLNSSIALGCDGGMGFNSDGNHNLIKPGHLGSSLTFRSEKLPTLTKEVVSVNGQPYVPDMTAHVGDEVVFRITVTKYASTTGITYTNAWLVDNALTGINLNEDISGELKNAGNGAKTITREVTYTIQNDDLGYTISNTANFSYNYQSQYSTGSMSSKASASASIEAVKFNPGSYVADFGLPMTFDFSKFDKPGAFVSGRSYSGVAEVTVQNDVVTYTLTSPLTGPDTVILTDEHGGSNSFTIYPATTVYYDGSFVEGLGVQKSGSQTPSKVGESGNYGLEAGYSNAASGALTDKASFTFTGTGVDVYANTTSNSCYVAVWLYDSSNNLEGLYLVDTAMKPGTSNYTAVPGTTSYNVPIVSLTNLDRGTYRVEIQRINPAKGTSSSKRADVALSGFRVYGTMSDGDSIYTQDGEANPTFTEIRNSVLDILGKDMTALLQNQYEQVYNKVDSIISDAELSNFDINQFEDLLLNGPKNEVYLTKGQSLTLTVPAGGTYQLGLKSLDAANGTVTVNNTEVNVTNVDMFYEVTAGTDGKITIANNNGGYISVSMLKSFSSGT